MCNPGNSEPWHIENHGLFRTLTYLKPNTYSEPFQRFKSVLQKYLKAIIIFPNCSILDLWQDYEYAHLSITIH